MSFTALLPDRCRIQNRSVDSTGKTDAETWAEQTADAPCRALIRIVRRYAAEKAQHATFVEAKFALRRDENVAIRDRIKHKGRIYDVIQVNHVYDRAGAHHMVAICEAVAGSV